MCGVLLCEFDFNVSCVRYLLCSVWGGVLLFVLLLMVVRCLMFNLWFDFWVLLGLGLWFVVRLLCFVVSLRPLCD